MNWQTEFLTDQLVRIEVLGDFSLRDSKVFIDELRHTLSKRDPSGWKVIVFFKNWRKPAPVVDQYEIGVYISEKLRGVKLAMVSGKKGADNLMVKTARNRGALVESFRRQEEAAKWLTT